MLRPSAGETLRAWLLSALVVHGAVAGNPDAKRLYDDLLSNYNKLVRPVVNTSDVLRVCIKLKLSQLIDVRILKKNGNFQRRRVRLVIGYKSKCFVRMSHYSETHKSLKKGSANTEKEAQKCQLFDYPVREKRKHRSKLEAGQKLLHFFEDQKLESHCYHSGDYPQFVTMSQWAAACQSLAKGSSHSYECSLESEVLDGFSKQPEDINMKNVQKSIQDDLALCDGEICKCPDRNDMESSRILYAPYGKTYEDINLYLTESFSSKNSEKKLNKTPTLEDESRKSKPTSNSLEVESTRRKNSRSPHTFKSKRKSHKVNRSEGFSKKFKYVDSMKEFKKILENFRIISEDDLNENDRENSSIIPAYIVLKLAEDAETNPGEKQGPRTFKLVFANDDEKKKKNSEKSSTSEETAESNEKFIDGENTKDSKVELVNRETNTNEFVCNGCSKMEKETRFRREFNAGLLGQLNNMLAQLTTVTRMLTDLLKTKSDEMKVHFLPNFPTKEKRSNEVLEIYPYISESAYCCLVHNKLEPICSECGRGECCKSKENLKKDIKEAPKDISEKMSLKKYSSIVYSTQAEADLIRKSQLRRKFESSYLGDKHFLRHRPKQKRRSSNAKKSTAEIIKLEKNENINKSPGASGDGKIRKKDFVEKEDAVCDYDDGLDEMEDEEDKARIEGDNKKLGRKGKLRRVKNMKKLSKDEVRLPLDVTDSESDEYDPMISSKGDSPLKLSSRASSRRNLKNQIMTTNLWVEQSWYDYKLRWDPKEYGGVHMLHVPSDHIWRPDIVLYNNADGNFEVTLATKATIYHQGLVEWKPPAIYKSSCEIDVEYFPFDEQTCVLKFGSWTYDGFKVDLRHMDEKAGSNVVEVGVDLSEFYLSVEWDILEVPAVRNEKFYTCCDEPYLDITFNITMRRKTLFYTVNIIIPCMGISFLTVLTFYLPSDSGEKVTLSISILISLHVFFLLVVEIIPPTSLVVPLLGKYLIFAMILVSISICVTVVVLNVHFRSPQTHRMAPWVKRVFIHILPRLLVMRRPQYHFEPHRFMSRRVIMQTVKGKEIQTSYYPYPYQSSAPAENPKVRDIDSILARQRAISKEDFSPESLADGEPVFGGSCQIHGPPPQSESEELSLSGVEGANGGEDLKSPTIKNPAFSHSMCPPEVHKSCFCVRFIAEHTKMLEDSTKVKEDWKYVAMVLDRLFLWIFTLAVLVGTAGIILQAPTLYDDRTPIDQQIAEIQTSTVIRCPPQ